MFRLVEALNGRLIGSKSWNKNVGILRPTNSPYQFYGLFGVIYGANCAMNDALICMRPEMAVKLGFTK